jgi:hypothetical protein
MEIPHLKRLKRAFVISSGKGLRRLHYVGSPQKKEALRIRRNFIYSL